MNEVHWRIDVWSEKCTPEGNYNWLHSLAKRAIEEKHYSDALLYLLCLWKHCNPPLVTFPDLRGIQTDCWAMKCVRLVKVSLFQKIPNLGSPMYDYIGVVGRLLTLKVLCHSSALVRACSNYKSALSYYITHAFHCDCDWSFCLCTYARARVE